MIRPSGSIIVAILFDLASSLVVLFFSVFNGREAIDHTIYALIAIHAITWTPALILRRKNRIGLASFLLACPAYVVILGAIFEVMVL